MLHPYNGVGDRQDCASVLWSSDALGEGDEVAAGVLDAEFTHAVEGGAEGHDDFYVFRGGEDGVDIVDLHVEIGWAPAGGCGDFFGGVFFHAGVGLVHYFSSALLKSHKAEFVAVGDFDGFREAEAIDPEGDAGFDLLDEQDRGDAFDVHGFDLLRWIGLQRNETQKESDKGEGEIAHDADSP